MPSNQWDLWRLPALLLWLLFFLVGLIPEPVYQALRDLGKVQAYHALVNSPHLLTLALAGYLGLFCFNRCREAGLSPYHAQDKALQLGILALIAFLPVDTASVLTAHVNPLMQHRPLLYTISILKILAWWYLLSMFVRYYAFGADQAFSEIPVILSSGWRTPPEKAATPLPSIPPEEKRDGPPLQIRADAQEQDQDIHEQGKEA